MRVRVCHNILISGESSKHQRNKIAARLKTYRAVSHIILLTKTTAAQIEVALSYQRVRGLYFLTVVFAVTIAILTYIILKL